MTHIHIHTTRLCLIPATAAHVRAEIHDRRAFAALLDTLVPDNWPPETVAEALPLFLAWLEAAPDQVGWFGWYAVTRSHETPRTLVGGGGFIGPAEKGVVMLGYSVLPQFQRQGFATELAGGLIRWAFDAPSVERIAAETEWANPASVRVLEKLGFVTVGASAVRRDAIRVAAVRTRRTAKTTSRYMRARRPALRPQVARRAPHSVQLSGAPFRASRADGRDPCNAFRLRIREDSHKIRQPRSSRWHGAFTRPMDVLGAHRLSRNATARRHGRKVSVRTTHTEDPFPLRGELAALMRAKDWSATPLGPVHAWPQSLRTIVRVLLTSKFAMWLGWGRELTFLYNDAYAAMTLGAKHPWALGRPSHEVWAEIWPEIEPRIDRVRQTGEATWDEDLMLFLERNGYREETYHTFSYSPVTDDAGAVAGLLAVVTEQTERVIGERRMTLLRDAAAAITAAGTEDALFDAVERTIAVSRALPFTLTYLQGVCDTSARLVSKTGLAADRRELPAQIDLTNPDSPWFTGASPEDGPRIVDLADLRLDFLSGATKAMLVPLPAQVTSSRAGLFVAALNPARPIDDACRTFVDLFAGQLWAGLAKVHAYDEERKRAEALSALDRAKTAFFSNISHEFRTPLTLLIGHLDEARESEMLVTPAQRNLLDVAHRNSLRLLKLVNMLLDFSRIESGRMRARYEPVDLPEFTADLASTFESAMTRAGLDYTVACDALGEPVYVDREMWEAVVLNLVSNAFKFTLEGAVHVSLARDDDHAVLRVRDTGVGIPEHELPHVLERFHRVEGTQGRSHEGSGIGLALVHELVKLHGGRLNVASELGRGTQLEVSIPLGTAHLPASHVAASATARKTPGAAPYVEEALLWLPQDTAATSAASSSASASSAGSALSAAASPPLLPSYEVSPFVAERDRATLRAADGTSLPIARVLLADDNADMREYARRLLATRWQVETVGNGRDALRAARAHRPDVIVTDVMMPELDGFGLLNELRADPSLRAIPVIMLSARAGEEARLEGLAASADDYLVKPFSARELLARVDAQIYKARTRAVEERHTRRLADLLAHAPVAIAVLRGSEYRYELANARYLELVNHRSLLGRTLIEAVPELEQLGVRERLDAVRATGQPLIGQSVIPMHRGPASAPEDHFFDFVYQPLFDADGRVESVVVMAHDVTTLASAKREADTANRLKDEFLATLSHELRTPLNAVLGYVQMVRAGALPQERLPAVLETIERNATLQRQLIDDVLDMSRIVTGNLRLDIGSVDLARVIEEAVETVDLAATAKGITLRAAMDRSGLLVAGDARRLQQVIWNVLSNAIKFTPRGGDVEIRLQRVGAQVEVTVSDTGVGIDPSFLPHLFQRFRQADSTLTREHGGLGLGLAISRHLVEAHGGRIEAASPGKGQGTIVRLELPLMADPASVLARQAARN